MEDPNILIVLEEISSNCFNIKWILVILSGWFFISAVLFGKLFRRIYEKL